MMVSARSPKPLRSPKAEAYGEFGSTHAPLSLPVIKKFLAVRSTETGGSVIVGSPVDGSIGVVVVGIVSVGPPSAPRIETTLRSLAFSLP
ncbi:unannotated protein [freshwater metagenome]|uniref:Unannotated protein n=1 Tax=freshwater metagenome TaxID=449393 RepID=A0A6J7GGF5_9ZZZZ